MFKLFRYKGLGFIRIMDVFTHWAPPDERVQLVNYAHVGYAIGDVVSFPVSGFIIQNFGWKYLLYISGKLFTEVSNITDPEQWNK